METKPRKEPLPQNIFYTTSLLQVDSYNWKGWCIHILCEEGSIEVVYKGETITLVEGDLFVMHIAELVSSISSGPKGCKLKAVIAPNSFLQNQLPVNNYAVSGSISLYTDPVMHLNRKEIETVTDDFLHIAKRVKDKDHPFFYEVMGTLCLKMMYDIFAVHSRQHISEPSNVQPLTLLSKFRAMLDAGEARRHRNPAYYAQKLNVTPKYLSNTLRRLTGQNVTNLISRYADPILIGYLKNTNLSLIQICEEMDFNSLSYFTRYVVKHLGMTPTEFRNTLRKGESES